MRFPSNSTLATRLLVTQLMCMLACQATAEPTCDQKRAALKDRAEAAAQWEERPNPKHKERRFREPKTKLVKVPGKVGGKTPDEIDRLSCDQIDDLYKATTEGLPSNDYALDEDGVPRFGKQEPSPANRPALVAPKTRPDLKTGDFPNPIGDGSSDEAWVAAFEQGMGTGPSGFKGPALQAAVDAAKSALAGGKGRVAAAEAGLKAGVAAMPGSGPRFPARRSDEWAVGAQTSFGLKGNLKKYGSVDVIHGVSKNADTNLYQTTLGLGGTLGESLFDHGDLSLSDKAPSPGLDVNGQILFGHHRFEYGIDGFGYSTGVPGFGASGSVTYTFAPDIYNPLSDQRVQPLEAAGVAPRFPSGRAATDRTSHLDALDKPRTATSSESGTPSSSKNWYDLPLSGGRSRHDHRLQGHR